ncbi:hypothetical protein SPBRAN_87 [uncultured Candidatus Thioglobus sp.]|nr:hypothetical protein SPBRAN_87 [uncultured Candidatus Thioglobus sp.]
MDLKNSQVDKICHPDNCLPIYAKVSKSLAFEKRDSGLLDVP